MLWGLGERNHNIWLISINSEPYGGCSNGAHHDDNKSCIALCSSVWFEKAGWGGVLVSWTMKSEARQETRVLFMAQLAKRRMMNSQLSERESMSESTCPLTLLRAF